MGEEDKMIGNRLHRIFVCLSNMKDAEIGGAKSEKNDDQKDRPLNLIPLVLVFCLGASESICNFIYKDNARNTPELSRYSWTGTNSIVVRIMGALFSGILMEKLKRVVAMQMSFSLLIIGLMTIYFVEFRDLIFFRLGDFIIKFASGMEASSIVYIADYNTPRRRSKLLLLIVPVTLLGFYTPYFIRSYCPSITKSEEILFIVGLAVVFLCLSHFYSEIPVGTPIQSKEKDEPVVEAVQEEQRSSDLELEEGSTSTYDSDDDPKAKLPQWMDSTYPAFAISFMILFSVWPKVGLMTLIDRYKPELMLEHEEQTVDRITSLVMLIFSIIGFCLLDYCRRRTFLIIYSVVLIVSSVMNMLFEYLFDGVEPEYKPPIYSFIPLISVWINLGLATIGSWTMMIVIMGELTPSKKRGLVTGILWATMLLQTCIVQFWLAWIQRSLSLYKFHLFIVLVAFKVLMWARTYGIDGRDKTQEQVDILWEEVIARRKTRYTFYRKCLMCCKSGGPSVSRAEMDRGLGGGGTV